MVHIEEWLIWLVTIHQYWAYAIIVVLAFAEGPYLSMAAGFLLRFDYFSFWPLYTALMMGDLIGDVAWYYIGRRWGHGFIRRFGGYFSITEKGVEKVGAIFHKYKHSILFISKISNGFGFALVTLMTAGMTRIPFWRYMTINFIGQFIWSGILIGIGYFLGHLYLSVNTILGRISVGALIVIVLALFMGYRKYLKTRAEQMNLS